MTKKHPSNTLIRLLLLSNVHACTCTCTCACSASNWCHRRKSHRLEWLAAEHAKRPDVARTRLLTVDTGTTETPERERARAASESSERSRSDGTRNDRARSKLKKRRMSRSWRRARAACPRQSCRLLARTWKVWRVADTVTTRYPSESNFTAEE